MILIDLNSFLVAEALLCVRACVCVCVCVRACVRACVCVLVGGNVVVIDSRFTLSATK